VFPYSVKSPMPEYSLSFRKLPPIRYLQYAAVCREACFVQRWNENNEGQGAVMRTSRDSLRCVALGILVGVVLVGCGGGGSHSNSPPIAVIGAAQTVAKRSLVTLDGSGSHDPDGNSITFSWTQTAGPSVMLISATTVKTAVHGARRFGILSFSLTVNDGQLSSSSATTTVTVINHAPVASAGADVTVAANAPVALDARAAAMPMAIRSRTNGFKRPDRA